jgi:predicted extracellular nuclease
VSVTSVTQLGSALTYTNPCTGASDTLNDRPSLRLRGTTNTIGFLQSFTIFVNHLRSLNGVADTTPCTLSTDGARVRAKRAAQANYVAGLVQDELTANPLAKIVVVVDFNAFEVNDGFTDVINTIAGSPAPATQVLTSTLDPAYPNLTNLLTLLPPAQRFSYLFDGNHQTLDHALLNPAAMTHFLGGGYARVNAEFNEFGFRGNFNTPERYSDHDPVYVYLSTQANLTAQTLITKTVPAFNRQTRLYSSTVTLKNNLPSPLNGPIKVVIMGLPATATPTNATVVTPSAATYELVGPLAAGATVSVPVVFSMPATVPVNFSVAVFATLPPV